MAGARKNTGVPVPHTRAIQADRRRHLPSLPPPQELEQRIEQLLLPAFLAQRGLFRALGLRERVLTLPATAALVISLIWQHLGSLGDAVRALQYHGLLWTEKIFVTRQSVAERLRTLPASLFHAAFEQIADTVAYRARQRRSYCAGSSLQQRAIEHFSDVLIADASTLDALSRKLALVQRPVGETQDAVRPLLAGKMLGLLDALTRQPRAVFYEAAAETNEQCFWDRIIEALPVGGLLLVDMGFCNYARFEQLASQGKWVLTRLKSNAHFQVITELDAPAGIRDQLVNIGSKHHRITMPMRVITETVKGVEHRYLTNLLDPAHLAAGDARGLYALRWRIEDAFSLVKRLLGLAYLHACSQNAVELQLWATWIMYAALVDLRAELAEKLELPAERLSVTMIYKAIYYYSCICLSGEKHGLIEFLAANAKGLGIIKYKRKTWSAFDTPLKSTLEP